MPTKGRTRGYGREEAKVGDQIGARSGRRKGAMNGSGAGSERGSRAEALRMTAKTTVQEERCIAVDHSKAAGVVLRDNHYLQ